MKEIIFWINAFLQFGELNGKLLFTLIQRDLTDGECFVQGRTLACNNVA